MSFHPMNLLYGWNSYPLIKPFLFLLDPENAHNLTIKMLGLGLGPQLAGGDDPILKTNLFGLSFDNPIGLAAGLDKQATAMDGFLGFGFGTIELGTVTPKPQIGNPRPRMFRDAKTKSLLNRFGFNSVGMDVFAERMAAWRAKPHRGQAPIAINIGKNKETTDDAVDYVAGMKKLASLADYVVVNISSPNTPGLRALQGRQRLADLLNKVCVARDETAPGKPVLVKIAPDLSEEELTDIAAVVLESKVQGVIITNTTLSRSEALPADMAKEAGGISGAPLFDLSTRVLSSFYRLTEGKIPLVGCGGVSNGAEAYAKIRAGASMVQVYTALIFEGPLVVCKMKRELAALLKRDGFKSVAEAVGVDHKGAGVRSSDARVA